MRTYIGALGAALLFVFIFSLGAQEAGGQAPKDMVLIKAGTFWMGSPETEADLSSDETRHEVTLTRDFLMSKYELTFDEYDAFCTATGRTKPSDKGWGRGQRPVINISWYDCIEYCNWRSRKEGLNPCYAVNGTTVSWNEEANGYRLPTEAEWEYACRAGTQTAFWHGNTLDSSQANFDGNYPYGGAAKGVYHGKTQPVGQYAANPWGLYDIHGNVWEWCWDWYGTYSSTTKDPVGPPKGEGRVLRGGCWYNDGSGLRSAYRGRSRPTDTSLNYGVRLVRFSK